MDINDLTIGQAKELNQLFGAVSVSSSNFTTFLEVGQKYLIRTVTMIFVGELVAQNATELKLQACSWIPDTARWMDMLITGEFNEIEPYIDPVIVSRAGIVDCTIWRHDLPTEQK